MRNKLIKLAWTFNRTGAVVGVIVVLLCRAALGQTIPNPSFEADTFTNSPGYISVNAAITGWTGYSARAGGTQFGVGAVRRQRDHSRR